MSISLLQHSSASKDQIIILLNQLTTSPSINNYHYYNIITYLQNNFYHKIFVYEIDKKPVGMITLLLEPKIIHKGKSVGHIEDLIIDKNYRNQNIAKKLINHVINIATYNNCYKIILDCNQNLIPFYEKNGFFQKDIQMRMNL